MALQATWDQLQLAFNNTNAKHTTLTIVAAISILLILVAFYRLFFHPLSHVPGPFLAKVTGLWRDAAYRRGKWHDEILDIHNKYGRVVRIAPNEVSVVDEWAMKNLYGHGHNAKKTTWYSVWDPPKTAPQLFSELDKTRHGFLRKRVSGAYSMSSILKYERYIQSCLNLLLEKVRTHAKKGHAVDMTNWTNAFAFDVVGELGYGTQLGMLKTETDVNNVRADIFAVFKVLSCFGHFPGQTWIFNNAVSGFFMNLLGAAPPMAKFRDWTVERVQDRLDNIDKIDRDDMLQHFCRMKGANGEELKIEEIIIEAMNLVGAGADTTSIGMRTCLYYIALNPDCYKRLQKEVDAIYEENQLDAPMTYLQTQKMPYLQAVIKEALRMLPSIVFQLLRHTPPNFTVRGIRIPEGTTIGISPVAQNRDQDIWGKDADEFRPDRWLEDEEKARYFDNANMTFGGSGPRMCVGRNIALVEIHKFIAQFVRNFDFEIANKDEPWHIITFWFAYQKEFMMNIKPRSKMNLEKA